MIEIEEEKLKDYYHKITSGKITLKQAAEQEGINKDVLRKLITRQIGDNENKKKDFFERLHQNKGINTFVELDDNIMSYIRLFLSGNITIKDASKECSINEETFNRKVFSVLSENPALLEIYLRNGANKRDYSQINTKLIIINMLKNDLSQTEMALQLGIPIRTLSGWVNKLPEDDELKKLAKESTYRVKHAITLTEEQLEILNNKLDEYIQKNNIVQQPLDNRSIEERELEKVEKFLEKVYKLESEQTDNGRKKYTRKQIMDILGVGYSAIRRAEIKRDKLKLMINNKDTKQIEGE